MIRHIVRKDLKLLWPLAAAVAALQIITTVLLMVPGPLQRAASIDSGEYGWVSNGLMPLVCLLGLIFLVLTVIHQDRFPGTDQDWLVRPIARRTLVLAKVAFICIAGLMPIFACDVATGLLERLPPGAVIEASAARSLLLFGIVVLPTALLGVVTRNLADALVLAVIILVVVVLGSIAASELKFTPQLLSTSHGWIIQLALVFAYVIVVPALVALQFIWRSTNVVRWLVIAVLALSPLVLLLPYRLALVAQQFASLGSGTPFLSFTADPKDPGQLSWDDEKGGRHLLSEPMARIGIPIQATLEAGLDGWRIDHLTYRIVSPDRGVLYQDDDLAFGSYQLPVVDGQNDAVAKAHAFLPVRIVKDAIARHGTLEFTLWLTAFQRSYRGPTATLDGAALDASSRCRRLSDRSDAGTKCTSTHPIAACTYVADDLGRHLEASWRGNNCRQFLYAPMPMSLWRDPYFTADYPGASSTARPDGMSAERQWLVVNFVPRAHAVRALKVALDGMIPKINPVAVHSKDGHGSEARFGNPSAPVADRQGMIYVVDRAENVLRRITPAGEVTTLAGVAGECGRTDGRGAQARFCHPLGLTIDATGTLYVVDAGNLLIRQVSPTGDVATVVKIANPSTTPYPEEWLHDGEVTRAPDGSTYIVAQPHSPGGIVVRIGPDGAVTKVAGYYDPRPPQRPGDSF